MSRAYYQTKLSKLTIDLWIIVGLCAAGLIAAVRNNYGSQSELIFYNCMWILHVLGVIAVYSAVDVALDEYYNPKNRRSLNETLFDIYFFTSMVVLIDFIFLGWYGTIILGAWGYIPIASTYFPFDIFPAPDNSLVFNLNIIPHLLQLFSVPPSYIILNKVMLMIEDPDFKKLFEQRKEYLATVDAGAKSPATSQS